jgi:hypothetical protein
MTPLDWTTFGILAGLMVSGFGYLSRLVHREVDGLRHDVDHRFDRVDDRLDRLEERYIRHLEQHATS